MRTMMTDVGLLYDVDDVIKLFTCTDPPESADLIRLVDCYGLQWITEANYNLLTSPALPKVQRCFVTNDFGPHPKLYVVRRVAEDQLDADY